MDKAHNLMLTYEFMKYLDDNSIETLDNFLPILEKHCEISNDLSMRMLHPKFKTIVDMKREKNGGQEFVTIIHEFSNSIMSIESEEDVFVLISMINHTAPAPEPEPTSEKE